MRELLWLSLPDQRPRRELYWLSEMPDTHVTAMAAQEPVGQMTWVPTSYRRPIRRFVEAGALAWANGVDDVLAQGPRGAGGTFDWAVSLELCSLVTGQLSARRRRQRLGARQAVLTWENLPKQPLYALPPYRQAFESCRDADLIICMVDAAAEHLRLNGFDPERVRVVKPGVDVTLFTPQAQAKRDRPTVVFTSPLAANKGIDTVLAAMPLVQRRIPDVQLLVAGRGPLADEVDAFSAAHPGLVHRLGNLDAYGVASLLARAHVFTTAPRPTFKWTEQLGLAYLEAQACGLPVVTTACGTNDEAVHAPNLLVEDSPESIAEGLIHFLDDPAYAAAVGQHNRQRMLREHDIRVQTRALADVFAAIE